MPDEPDPGPPPAAQGLDDEPPPTDGSEGTPPPRPETAGTGEAGVGPAVSAQPETARTEAVAGAPRPPVPTYEAVPFPPPPAGAPPLAPAALPGAAEAARPPVVPAPAGVRVGCAVLEVILVVAGLGVGWVLWWVALWHRGSSPARSILHLELVGHDGASPGWRRTASRELPAKLLAPLAPISALVWLGGRSGLWDRMTGTTVTAAGPGAPPRRVEPGNHASLG